MSGFYVPNPVCLIAGHDWGPWLPCRDGRMHRFCERCEAVQ